ncbi:beta-lactamase domain protein [Thermodesulfobium narugense DSM 14796]|uniref:Beta-lactamase domain protein n=1 Tax=Thermodesulfobium narugense DSM 14796 TaxID=747365 RepID=M1E4N8_9BACT|nr:MBL fold metallo-hydrolase [Thermodesulfobium narugense]AEE14342.1 beta-lactamase domain protein [Thermodesulfobium narugense DSM 14796]
MKITIVMDNCVHAPTPYSFKAEHGMSILINISNKLILFDTGQSGSIIHNLSLLGVNPKDLDMIVLSHGHYDHTGGLLSILGNARKKIPVFLHKDAFLNRYSLAGEKKFHIGIPYSKKYLESLGANFVFVEEILEIVPGLFLSGTIERKTDYEKGDSNLVIEKDGKSVKDPILDDMALYAIKDNGLIALTGCAHAGIINIIRYGFKLLKTNKLYAIVGGTHLGPADPVQRENTISDLLDAKPTIVAANHCTGFSMMAKLKDSFGDSFIAAFVGTEIDFS